MSSFIAKRKHLAAVAVAAVVGGFGTGADAVKLRKLN